MKPFMTILLGLLLTNNGLAQSDSLSAYVETALKNNPTVQQKWSEYKASVEKIPQVGSLPDPELNMGFFLEPMEQLNGNQIANVQLMQEFPWFGVLKNAKDEMSLMAKASFASLESAKLEVAYEVRIRWYELYRNRQQVTILQKNLELLRQMKRLATTTYQAGSGSKNATVGETGISPSDISSNGGGMGSMGENKNVGKRPTINATSMATSGMSASRMTEASAGDLSTIYSLQQEENELNNQLASLEDAYSYLAFGFNTLLNRDETASISLPANDYVDPLQPPSDTSLNGNPMLAMLDYEREAQEARKKMSERMGYPMIGVGLSYSVISKGSSSSMMNGRDMLMPMVSVSLPFYRKKYKALEQETTWLQSATTHAYEAMRNKLQADFKEAVFRFRDALRRVQLVETQQKLVAKTYQLQQTRLAASNGSLQDLLRTGRQQVDYALQLVNARFDVLIAQAQIRQLAGNY